MSWNKERLSRANLYLILDRGVLPYQELLELLKPAVRAGVDIVQLRDKNGSAGEMLNFCRQAKKITAQKALFIVNDRVDVAVLSGADGVHLGQDDISCIQARGMMGKNALIGISCQSEAHVRKAQGLKADYVGFGSVFKTKTKPEREPMDKALLKRAVKTAKLPLFAIGGIALNNIETLFPLGVNRVAVCRDILLVSKPEAAVRSFKKVLNKF